MALSYRKRGPFWHVRGTVRVGRQVFKVNEHSTGCATKAEAEAVGAAEEARIRSEALDGLEGEDEQVVEDAVADFDDVVAAAFFAGLADRVRPAAIEVARRIRRVPDPFAFMAETGRQVARSRVVAEDLALHDYWLAIADAGDWA